MTAAAGTAHIASRIFVVRGKRVMLDSDLSALYGVEVRRLNEQVRRNVGRFPPDFAFVVSDQELGILKSQIATSSWGGKRKLPWAFTEHGALMAATLLRSTRAIEVSVYVVRAFVQLREAMAAHKEIAKRVDELERKVGTHDGAIREILQAIRCAGESWARTHRVCVIAVIVRMGGVPHRDAGEKPSPADSGVRIGEISLRRGS